MNILKTKPIEEIVKNEEEFEAYVTALVNKKCEEYLQQHSLVHTKPTPWYDAIKVSR